MSLQETELHEKIVAALNTESQQLDYRVTNKLAQARRQALQQKHTKQALPFWQHWMTQHTWQTAAVSAFTLVVSIAVMSYVTLDQPSSPQLVIGEPSEAISQEPNDIAISRTVELEALSNGEDLDLFENMELYQWLEAEFG
jgi:anti-sigma-K factor RskA